MSNRTPIDPPFVDGAGRDGRGRFAAGNAGGPGNPHAAEVGRHRAAFFASLKDSDVANALKVIRGLMTRKRVRDADRLAAAKELLDRVIGKTTQTEVLQRIEALERLMNERRPS